MLLIEKEIETEEITYAEAADKVGHSAFYNYREYYLRFFTHEDLLDFDKLKNKMFTSLIFPTFEYTYLDEKETRDSFEDALKESTTKILREVAHLKDVYKRRSPLALLINKLKGRESITKEDFNKYNDSLNKAEKLLNDLETFKKELIAFNPELDCDNLLNKKVTLLKNPFKNDLTVYVIESERLEYIGDSNSMNISEYKLTECYYSKSYSDDTVDFTIDYLLSNEKGRNISLSLKRNTEENIDVSGLHSNDNDQNLIFVKKEDAIKYMKNIHKRNEEYLETL